MEKIYISLTSIFQNQNILLETLKSIVNQTIHPDMIYLYLSEEPYLLDIGFKDKTITNNNLLNFINENCNIIKIGWVENIGPYRKLLPLLKDKWNENCVIITIDDDTVYNKNLIKNMINDYKNINCVINYRGFTPYCENLENFDYLSHKAVINRHLYNFPTGKGGILYHPQFFHKTGDLIFNKDYFILYCKTADDIWFYLVRICNNIDCYINDKSYMTIDNTNEFGLFTHFNRHNNTNNFKNTVILLKKNNYLL